MYPTISLFGQDLSSWMLLVLLGAWVGYFSLRVSLLKKHVSTWQISFFALIAAFFWFLGAHFFQVLTVGGEFFPSGSLPNSGYVLYGGMIGFVFAGLMSWVLFGWRRKFTLSYFWDEGAWAMAWVFFFGRIGCFFYGCCYGSPSGKWPGYVLNFDRWDHAIRPFPQELRGVSLHPAPLYEALGFLLILAVLFVLRKLVSQGKIQLPSGVMGWLFLLIYSLVRFILEYIRLDPRGGTLLELSPSQWMAVIASLLSAVFLLKNCSVFKKSLS